MLEENGRKEERKKRREKGKKETRGSVEKLGFNKETNITSFDVDIEINNRNWKEKEIEKRKDLIRDLLISAEEVGSRISLKFYPIIKVEGTEETDFLKLKYCEIRLEYLEPEMICVDGEEHESYTEEYYIIDLEKMIYKVKYGRREYRYKDAVSFLDSVKLYFWEYRGIEVLPEIDLVELLKTDHAKNMRKRRQDLANKYFNKPLN